MHLIRLQEVQQQTITGCILQERDTSNFICFICFMSCLAPGSSLGRSLMNSDLSLC